MVDEEEDQMLLSPNPSVCMVESSFSCSLSVCVLYIERPASSTRLARQIMIPAPADLTR